MVCGDPKVDLDLLKSVCTYEGYSAEDEPVQLFWSVMEQLSDVDRAQVIQFTWSRSRLPLSRSGFTDRFKIKRMSGGDGAFPLAHTCFFQVGIATSLFALPRVAVLLIRRPILGCCVSCLCPPFTLLRESFE